jgi:hypothetical protein
VHPRDSPDPNPATVAAPLVRRYFLAKALMRRGYRRRSLRASPVRLRDRFKFCGRVEECSSAGLDRLAVADGRGQFFGHCRHVVLDERSRGRLTPADVCERRA